MPTEPIYHRVPCPSCAGRGHYTVTLDEPVPWASSVSRREPCRVCHGDGSVYVASTPEPCPGHEPVVVARQGARPGAWILSLTEGVFCRRCGATASTWEKEPGRE